jgi:hypothetical protein
MSQRFRPGKQGLGQQTQAYLLGPPSTILGARPSTCTMVLLQGGGAATPPSAAIGSHHYAWTNHGRPSIHTTLSADPSSTTDVRRPVAAGHFYILDVVAHHVGPAIAGQLLQHDDAPDTALTYGVGH